MLNYFHVKFSFKISIFKNATLKKCGLFKIIRVQTKIYQRNVKLWLCHFKVQTNTVILLRHSDFVYIWSTGTILILRKKPNFSLRLSGRERSKALTSHLDNIFSI